ncbi:MAG TPA: glycosyltransferase family 4 protein [Candidatus Paceibacterota bacterium]|nr:glycosyltransferase family 4 protein [Candidatus Paceibacterota bacterium]
MKVIYLVPGSGGSFYCQNCLRDLALIKALRVQGVDAISLPLYLPATSDPEVTSPAPTPVFYGAIRIYLEQLYPWLKRFPQSMLAWLDSPFLLKWAAKRAGSTRARGLEDMTISMLRGESGQQASELDTLVQWLEKEGKPDIVHLSNGLLLGLARQLKQRLNCVVVCSLQDEDQWIDAQSPHGAAATWRLMSERALDANGFIAPSRYYARLMEDRLKLKSDRIEVIPIGIDPDPDPPAPLLFNPPVLGYLSRMCESLGLGLLVDAFIRLKQHPRLHDLKLKAMGGFTPDDRLFLNRLKQRLSELNLAHDVEFSLAYEPSQRRAWLRQLSVLSVPIPRGEAFGAFQIEALAAGIPLVQPRVGAFPEVIETTGGGLLYDPDRPQALDEALVKLLTHPDRARQLASAGRHAVREQYTVQRMSRQVEEVYRRMLSRAQH